ncbi:LOW QUALITY PROTEIN: guanine deaminase-like [Dendronephthya gigantea]|uniref:LOW QUALITY PROTEIN: guanine deaminase-like n=1 Tax=Dendronephthya gigantea TaxID=151771 RepID=UPI00106C34E6|nr:LOW QUALITY PROTEIN: guanine deaminase-like [Dendronephthya gigantea]
MEPFAITGTIVDCSSDESRNLRINQQALLVINRQGTIVYRGVLDDLNKAKEEFDVTEVIELRDHDEFLLPGFIDTHIHASQYPNCGLALDLSLLKWLENYTYPLEAKIGQDLNFARKVYESVVSSTLSHGTTTAVYFATIQEEASVILAETASRLGQRAFVGKVNMDQNSPDYYREGTREYIAATKSFVNRVFDFEMKSDLVEPIITPRFAPTCTRVLLEELGTLAKEKGLRIQTHLSECPSEVEWVRKCFPWSKNYTDVYNATGILTDKTILAHGIFLDHAELSVIKSVGAGIAHCPNSNNSIRSGSMAAANLQGVKVGLGTDCSGGYSPSMINAMRFAISTSNNMYMAKECETSFHYNDVISLATRGSAKVCGVEDKVGGFDIGFQFDALRIRMSVSNDTRLFGFETVEDMIHKFVFLGDERNLVQVFVKGKCVKNLLFAETQYN